jgi:MarR family transcriptional regulator, organic hydroperoxide resistance regulator
LSIDKRKGTRAVAPTVTEPEASTAVDRIIVEIRMFIAASIFFNTRAAEKAGLGLTDMQMLNLLQVYGPSTPGFLGTRSGLSSGGVTVALDRLEKAGYVRREPNPADRRSLLVVFVPSKLRKLQAMYDAIERESREKIASLPQRDLEAVLRFFDSMRSIETDASKPGMP